MGRFKKGGRGNERIVNVKTDKKVLESGVGEKRPGQRVLTRESGEDERRKVGSDQSKNEERRG